MESRNLELPSKIRKRRFPTTSSSSFANASLSQLLMDKTDSPRNEKCKNREEESLPNSGDSYRVNNEVFDLSITNVDQFQNKSRCSPGRVSAPEVINPGYRLPSNFMEKDKGIGGMHVIYDEKLFEAKSRPCDNIETESKDHKCSTTPKAKHGLDEIKHSLTVSKQLLKLLTHIWSAGTNHDPHPTTVSLASTLNHELNKARYHVNKLIQEQRSNTTIASESKDQDKIRFAVKTIARELETERKLRRQTERMNKKLGRELEITKSSLAKEAKKAESQKQETEILEKLCEKMAHNIDEDRIELEELRKESERIREEMEEEREMLRVADMLREERLHMKLVDAKHEYEDKHEQMNILVRDLKEFLEAENGIEHLKKTPKILSWYHNKHRDETETTTKDETTGLLWYKKIVNESGTVNDDNTLIDVTTGLSWYQSNSEVTNTQNEIIGRNSDCIEWEFGLDMKNESGRLLNGVSEERVLGFSASPTMKEYEDEMERYKMIKDLRDRIVSCSDLSRGTIESGSYI